MRVRSTIFGYAVLIVVLTAGAAQGLSGSNTVFTDDLAPGAVTTSDIRENAVTGSRILNSSVTGSDVNESTIPGFKKVYFAKVAVDAGGTVVGVQGDATGTAGSGSDIIVQFPSSVSTCASVAVAGNVSIGGSSYVASRFASVDPSGNAVTVRMRSDTGAGLPSSFHLVVVCP